METLPPIEDGMDLSERTLRYYRRVRMAYDGLGKLEERTVRTRDKLVRPEQVAMAEPANSTNGITTLRQPNMLRKPLQGESLDVKLHSAAGGNRPPSALQDPGPKNHGLQTSLPPNLRFERKQPPALPKPHDKAWSTINTHLDSTCAHPTIFHPFRPGRITYI